jgi:hypothetical protein
MAAGIYDIITEGTSDFELFIEYVDYNNSAISLSGKSILFTIKRSYLYNQNNLFSFSSNGTQTEGDLDYPTTNNTYGYITINSNNIYLNINKETLSDLSPGKYFYSLKIIGTSTETLLRGKFEVEGF